MITKSFRVLNILVILLFFPCFLSADEMTANQSQESWSKKLASQFKKKGYKGFANRCMSNIAIGSDIERHIGYVYQICSGIRVVELNEKYIFLYSSRFPNVKIILLQNKDNMIRPDNSTIPPKVPIVGGYAEYLGTKMYSPTRGAYLFKKIG